MDEEPKPNSQVKRWIEAYASDPDHNGPKIARDLGYKDGWAASKRFKARFPKAIAEALEATKPIEIGSVKWLKQRLQAEIVDAGNATARIRAIELLAKLEGHLQDKVDVSLDRKSLIKALVSEFDALKVRELNQPQIPKPGYPAES